MLKQKSEQDRFFISGKADYRIQSVIIGNSKIECVCVSSDHGKIQNHVQ